MYRVDRIDDLAVGERPNAFTKPKGFDIKTMVDSQPWEAGLDPLLTTEVRFDEDVAWWAARSLGLDEPDGDLITTVEVANRDAFVGWILSFGTSAVVLGPEEMRAEVRDRVNAALGQVS